MVDATSSFGTDAFNDPRDAQAGAEALQAVIHTNGALEIYAAACTESLHAPAQSPLWVEKLEQQHRQKSARRNLDARQDKQFSPWRWTLRAGVPFTIARFIGGSHANGNFPALGSNPTSALTKNAAHLLTAGIKRARPDIDLLALERQLPALGGVDNPLAALPRRESPNIALAADLSGGFEAVLGRVNAKRKRKKHRSQLNKFEAAGGFRRIKANTPEQVEWLLSAFFDMKAERFLQAGITDVFAPKAVRAALTGIFTRALEEEHPSFVLHGLEVGGKLRAVTGASRFDGRIVCDFCAFADDELSVASPGEFLFFENILEACETGICRL